MAFLGRRQRWPRPNEVQDNIMGVLTDKSTKSRNKSELENYIENLGKRGNEKGERTLKNSENIEWGFFKIGRWSMREGSKHEKTNNKGDRIRKRNNTTLRCILTMVPMPGPEAKTNKV